MIFLIRLKSYAKNQAVNLCLSHNSYRRLVSEKIEFVTYHKYIIIISFVTVPRSVADTREGNYNSKYTNEHHFL